MINIQSSGKIVVSGDNVFFGIGGFAVLMVVLGVCGAVGAFPFFREHTAADVFGFFFLCAWTLFALTMAIHSFRNKGKRIIIDREGVKCESLLFHAHYDWVEIKDWGLSYAGKTRGGVDIYALYFSKEVQTVKNDCRKKLKGKMIQCYLFGDEYHTANRLILPFCREHTAVSPFVAEDRPHII